MTKLIVPFRSFAKAPNKTELRLQKAVTHQFPSAVTPKICSLWMEDLSRFYPKLNLCKLIHVQVAMLKAIWPAEWELTSGC
jgi:hypothetical protein